MPVAGKNTLTINEYTHREIGSTAKGRGQKIYEFVDEVWAFYKRKGADVAPPAIQFTKPKAEAGFEWIKVPERLAPKFQRLVDLLGQDPKVLRSILDIVESSKSSSR